MYGFDFPGAAQYRLVQSTDSEKWNIVLDYTKLETAQADYEAYTKANSTTRVYRLIEIKTGKILLG